MDPYRVDRLADALDSGDEDYSDATDVSTTDRQRDHDFRVGSLRDHSSPMGGNPLGLDATQPHSVPYTDPFPIHDTADHTSDPDWDRWHALLGAVEKRTAPQQPTPQYVEDAVAYYGPTQTPPNVQRNTV